jgi:hypothetical protein
MQEFLSSLGNRPTVIILFPAIVFRQSPKRTFSANHQGQCGNIENPQNRPAVKQLYLDALMAIISATKAPRYKNYCHNNPKPFKTNKNDTGLSSLSHVFFA